MRRLSRGARIARGFHGYEPIRRRRRAVVGTQERFAAGEEKAGHRRQQSEQKFDAHLTPKLGKPEGRRLNGYFDTTNLLTTRFPAVWSCGAKAMNVTSLTSSAAPVFASGG